jgi:adenylate kinase
VYLILLGGPGTGKGTQAKILAEKFQWLHVSTGDMLREAVKEGSELGRIAKEYMDQGALVPDSLVIKMLIERISRRDAQSGLVLDGFPRNLPQAIALDTAMLDKGKFIDLAVNLAVPDEELVRRLSGRWICRNCGAIYHEQNNPSKTPGRCDRCGDDLYQRNDDKAETVRARLETQRPPPDMLMHYRRAGRLVEIDGTRPVDEVTKMLVAVVRKAQNGPAGK